MTLYLLPALAGMLAADPGRSCHAVSRLVGQDEVIWRVPVAPRPPLQRISWVEHKKGPKCVPTRAIRRAMLSGPGNVDFILANRTRIRAKFDRDCPALDYYGGLYLVPEDEMLCAKRDTINSRIGGSCEIKRFKLLMPKLRD
ncbi:MAG: hypothetical protein ABIS23_08135 [Sphingomicrobium sp.]